jgi:hypothetical protein
MRNGGGGRPLNSVVSCHPITTMKTVAAQSIGQGAVAIMMACVMLFVVGFTLPLVVAPTGEVARSAVFLSAAGIGALGGMLCRERLRLTRAVRVVSICAIGVFAAVWIANVLVRG